MEIINPEEPNMVFHPSSLDSATFFVVAMAPLGAGALPLLEAVGKWYGARNMNPRKSRTQMAIICQLQRNCTVGYDHREQNEELYWKGTSFAKPAVFLEVLKQKRRLPSWISMFWNVGKHHPEKSDTMVRARLSQTLLPTVWAWTPTMRICCT